MPRPGKVKGFLDMEELKNIIKKQLLPVNRTLSGRQDPAMSRCSGKGGKGMLAVINEKVNP